MPWRTSPVTWRTSPVTWRPSAVPWRPKNESWPKRTIANHFSPDSGRIQYIALTGTEREQNRMNRAGLIIIIVMACMITGCTRHDKSGFSTVQGYIPQNAVIAHRGTTYWAPELTEAAFRWARNCGADYLELDVHRTKDSMLVIIHDHTFRRTTDVAEKFPGRVNDPVGSFTFEEIMTLDAGTAFNNSYPERAQRRFAGLEVLVFEDVFRIAEGRRISRHPDGRRIFTTDRQGRYQFEYEADPADNGNRPGIYIETKIPDRYPGLEEQIYDELTRLGWNPLEGDMPAGNEPSFKNGKVNLGNTRGKVLLQTFSREGMMNFSRLFGGKVPMSFLVGNPSDNTFASEEVTDDIITFGLSCGAHFIGTNLGETNDGLTPAFAAKIRAAGLMSNVYSFNTTEQMEKYFGEGEGSDASPLTDAMITNRADLTIDFYHSRKMRSRGMEKDPEEILADLGYL